LCLPDLVARGLEDGVDDGDARHDLAHASVQVGEDPELVGLVPRLLEHVGTPAERDRLGADVAFVGGAGGKGEHDGVGGDDKIGGVLGIFFLGLNG
jgi:hypothetical protein